MFSKRHRELAEQVSNEFGMPIDLVMEILTTYYSEVKKQVNEMSCSEIELKNIVVFKISEKRINIKKLRYEKYYKMYLRQTSERALQLAENLSQRLIAIERGLDWLKIKNNLKVYYKEKQEKEALLRDEQFIKSLEE